MKIIPLLLPVLAILSTPVMSYSQVSLSMSPTRGEHKSRAGKRLTDAFLITNLGHTTSRLTVEVSDWTMDGKGDVKLLAEKTQENSASRWIKVNPKTFVLGPDSHKQVRYTLSVPKGTRPAGYRTALIVTASPSDPSGLPPRFEGRRNQIEIHGRFIYFIYLTVGKPVPKARLKSFGMTPQKDGFRVEFQVENTGEVHFRTGGMIEIDDPLNQKVGEITLPSVPVLPSLTRTIPIEWKNKDIPPGKYTAKLRLDIGREELLGDELEIEILDVSGK